MSEKGRTNEPSPTPRMFQRTIPVVVTHLPEKPLLKDSTRLISIAALLLSVITSGYATYSAWQSHNSAALEEVSKLIEQYYVASQQLKTLDPIKDMGYVNVTRTQLRSTAARALNESLNVGKYIDDGIWM